MPLAFLGVLSVLNPDYVDPLFEDPAGRVMVVVAALGLILGSLTLKRLVEIDV
jgi:tight adherence protein B